MLKYAVNDKDVHVSSIEVKKTSEGDDIFARFTIGKGKLQYAAHIDPREFFIYTDDSRITGLWACHNFSNEEIWWNLGTLDDIQQKREKEDLMSRLGSKLSKLVKCPIVVEDCKAAGNQYLVFATNGRAYFINRDGKTWSTLDINPMLSPILSVGQKKKNNLSFSPQKRVVKNQPGYYTQDCFLLHPTL